MALHISDGVSDGPRLGWLETVADSLRNIEGVEDGSTLSIDNALCVSKGAGLAVGRLLGASVG